jgi:hypothetical protein
MSKERKMNLTFLDISLALPALRKLFILNNKKKIADHSSGGV